MQWNIGGGRVRNTDADSQAYSSYANGEERLEIIAETIKATQADLVTLQETHADRIRIQANLLAERTDLSYWVHDVYDESHLKKGQGLGQAVLSRFPILSHRFEFFENPKLEMTAPTGEHWKMHNKGTTTVELDLGEAHLELKTLHVFPYRKFGSDPCSDEPRVKVSRESIEDKLHSNARLLLIQGDFNYDGESLKLFLPGLFEAGIQEILQQEPTTPKGRHYDHALYRGFEIISSHTLTNVLTDHYPIVSTFRIE